MKMQQEDKGLLCIKHYSNLQRLIVEQLQAIKNENLQNVKEFVAQKQIILDSIATLHATFDINSCQPDIKEKLKILQIQITSSENESQQILKERCAKISKTLLARRREMNIHQAYENYSSRGNSIILNIKK